MPSRTSGVAVRCSIRTNSASSPAASANAATVSGARQEARRQREQHERDRDGKQERPAPAQLGQQASGDQTERETARTRRRVDAQRAVPLRAFRESRRDDREAGGRRGGRGGGPSETRDLEKRADVGPAAD